MAPSYTYELLGLRAIGMSKLLRLIKNVTLMFKDVYKTTVMRRSVSVVYD